MGSSMAAVFGPPGPTLSRSALVHDPFDREAFEEVLPRAPGLRLLLETSREPGKKDLAFDLFCSFYKYFVKLLPADQVIEECRSHRDLLDRALGLREHEKLRAWTRLKSAETALATELVLDLLLNEPSAEPERARDQTPDAAESPAETTAADASTERLREVLRDVREDLEGAVELVAAWSAGPGEETRLPPELKRALMRNLVRNHRPRPVYLCLDNSGSMSGEKEVWAKASALALAHMALQHGRLVEIVLFGDAADPLRVVSLDPRDKGPIRLEKVLDVASYFLGGGTDFQKPLSHVLDTILAGHEASGNDLLFVSDGLCPLPEAFVRRFFEAKGRHNIRLTPVVIGGEAFSLAPIPASVPCLEDDLEAGDELAAQDSPTSLPGGAPTRYGWVRAPTARRTSPRRKSPA